MWTDLTCICKYKYDLTTFEQGKDIPLPNTKEKGIFDVSGCRTLQSHQTLASAITKWWDTHGERIGEEYDPCKVYTLFYDLSFVPKKFSKRADDKNEDLQGNIDSEAAESVLCADTAEVLANNVDFYNNANDQKARLQTATLVTRLSVKHTIFGSQNFLFGNFERLPKQSIDAKWENKSLTRQFLALNDKFCLASDSLPIPLQKYWAVDTRTGHFYFLTRTRYYFWLQPLSEKISLLHSA